MVKTHRQIGQPGFAIPLVTIVCHRPGTIIFKHPARERARGIGRGHGDLVILYLTIEHHLTTSGHVRRAGQTEAGIGITDKGTGRNEYAQLNGAVGRVTVLGIVVAHIQSHLLTGIVKIVIPIPVDPALHEIGACSLFCQSDRDHRVTAGNQWGKTDTVFFRTIRIRVGRVLVGIFRVRAGIPQVRNGRLQGGYGECIHIRIRLGLAATGGVPARHMAAALRVTTGNITMIHLQENPERDRLDTRAIHDMRGATGIFG